MNYITALFWCTTFFHQTHQTKLNVIVRKFEFLFINHEYIDANASVDKISKTDFGLSIYLDIHKQIPEDVVYTIHAFAEYSNTYRQMPMIIKGNLCRDLDNLAVAQFNSKMDKQSDLEIGCPYVKKVYYVKKFVPGTMETADLPWDKVMYRIKLTHGNIKLVEIKLYFILDHERAFLDTFLDKLRA